MVLRGTLCALLAALVVAAPAAADDWWPHPADAQWTYEWTDSTYATTATKEKVTVKEQKGKSFTLQWSTLDLGNPDDAVQGIGLMVASDTTFGPTIVDWR